MARVDAAEKEASEVLHSLLSVERIEKHEQIHVDSNGNQSPVSHNFQTPTTNPETIEADGQIQWHTPVSIPTHSIFSSLDTNNTFQPTIDQQVIWEGHTVQVDEPHQNLNAVFTTVSPTAVIEVPSSKKTKSKTCLKPSNVKKKILVKKKKKDFVSEEEGSQESTKLEESVVQVKERFKRGCECQDESCFRGLNPESVYRHRLNIAELTKAEHDMYLMGVTMACLANPDETVRHKERRRLRAQYVYQGRRVCLDAFLYLENCTHYQLKRIRKHVMTHGVAPRVHGNHGKKPHNRFSLDIYRHATEFLKQYLETHIGETGITNSKQIIQLPWDITRKNLHDAYKEYGQILEPGTKLMGYSTFRHFMKEQFPHVKFNKVEAKCNVILQQGTQQLHPHPQVQLQPEQQQQQQETIHLQNNSHVLSKQQQQQSMQTIEKRTEHHLGKSLLGNTEVQQVIPLVIAPNDGGNNQHHSQAFLVTPISQIISGGNITATQQNTSTHTSSNTFSYQIANTGYVINEHGNLISPLTNGQQHTSYSFNRI